MSETAGVSDSNPVPSTISLPGAGRLVQPSTNTSTIPFASPALNRHARVFLRSAYDALFAAHGPQKWWPGRSRFEIIVGAILTQNTSWTNVERAIRNLREAALLSPNAIRRIHFSKLARLLRPSGYYRQKTKTLKSFVNFLYDAHAGSLTRMLASPTPILRDQLLALRGIGPETADSILLYAGKHPVFVVDAYARRILERHGHASPKVPYDEIRKLFESSLPVNHRVFNEFHALIVHTGKGYCRKRNPLCSQCALRTFFPLATETWPATLPERPSFEAQSRVL
jgi:endonuclease III related protein